jgi:hypothetical protein
MGRALTLLWRRGLEAFSSDWAFTIAANAAIALVMLCVLLWFVLVGLPRPQSAEQATPQSERPTCSWLEGRCW